MSLTDTAIRKVKPLPKAFKMFENDGLYLEISPKGGKWWRWKFYQGKKENRLSLGVYPEVGLKAQWAEIDFEKAEWCIPAERMKMRVQHIFPLSRQSVDILRELKPLTNRPMEGKPSAPLYIFPGGQSPERPMC